MADYIKQIETNLGHDWVTVKATKNDDEFALEKDTVQIEFTGRDPAMIILRYTDTRDVRAIGQALIEAADYLEPTRDDTTVERVYFHPISGGFAVTKDGKEWRLSTDEIKRALNGQHGKP